MPDELLTLTSANAIASLLDGVGEYVTAEQTLESLTTKQALMKLEGWPHSIAEVVAHLLFWQRQVLAGIHDQPGVVDVSTAAIGWPQVKRGDWPRIRDEFLVGLEQSREITRDPGRLERVLPSNRTVGFRLVSHAGHDAYHLGQVVLLRQLIGAWPPPSGGMTW
jgi:hypothetical protein